MITEDWLVVSPAYGRDYNSAKEAETAFLAGFDFVMQSAVGGGRYCSVRDFAPHVVVEVRYRGLTRVASVTVPYDAKERFPN